MTLNPRLIFRWIAFLLAAGFCLRTLFFGNWDGFGGPFRFLTVWALFCSFFAFSRMMAIEEGRSERRWDGFVSMTAVINTMVVFLCWRIFLTDPTAFRADGQLGLWYVEYYLHGLGPVLQVIDSIFIHQSYRRLGAAMAWLIAVVVAYLIWAELVLQAVNTDPIGSVTSGLPYPFLNNLALTDRLLFYSSNLATGAMLLLILAGIARGFKRRFPVQATP